MPGDIALIRTGWGRYFGTDNARYLEGEPGLDVPAAKWLINQGIVAIGADNMAVEVLPNPNKALGQFVKANLATGKAFDAVSWLDVAKANVSWDSVSWDSVSWNDAAWNVVSWADVSWESVSWADVSWADVSWADVSWADTSYEDAAEGDTSGDPEGYALTPEQAAAVMADPELAPDPNALPTAVEAAVEPPPDPAPGPGSS